MTECSAPSALIFDIYRGTTHDGPGMRTTLFFKGCPLSCKWCHNPEGISFENGITYTKGKCMGCGLCGLQAGREIVRVQNGEPVLAAPLKEIPPVCVDNCPSGALAMEARAYSVDELFVEAVRDRAFFESFGGGVTVSGGEPTASNKFVLSLLKKLRESDIHTALDTSGYVPWPVLESLLPYTDLVLYDIKVADNERHLALTGVENQLIIDNLFRLISYKKRIGNGLSIWVRTPLIPNDTATEENISTIGSLLNLHGGEQIDRWELCSFNNTCASKYQRLGLPWHYSGTALMTDIEAEDMLTAAAKSFDKEKTKRSGFTRKPDGEST